jgi:hypothetical protein
VRQHGSMEIVGCQNEFGLVDIEDARARPYGIPGLQRYPACLQLVKREVDGAKDELQKTVRFNSDSLAPREELGWLMALAGDWEGGMALIRDAKLHRSP